MTRRHEVSVPLSPAMVLHRASCLCGWSFGFDPATLQDARRAAAAHMAEVLGPGATVVESIG